MEIHIPYTGSWPRLDICNLAGRGTVLFNFTDIDAWPVHRTKILGRWGEVD